MERIITREHMITDAELTALYEKLPDLRPVIESLTKNGIEIPEDIQEMTGAKIVLFKWVEDTFLAFAGPSQQQLYSKEGNRELYDIAWEYEEARDWTPEQLIGEDIDNITMN